MGMDLQATKDEKENVNVTHTVNWRLEKNSVHYSVFTIQMLTALVVPQN